MVKMGEALGNRLQELKQQVPLGIEFGKVSIQSEAVAVAINSLDSAAEKGVIHPNNAARRKSRLVKKLNQAQAKPAAE